jgi:hypothetical protein
MAEQHAVLPAGPLQGLQQREVFFDQILSPTIQ